MSVFCNIKSFFVFIDILFVPITYRFKNTASIVTKSLYIAASVLY